MEKLIRDIVLYLDRNLSLSQDQREIAEYALYNMLITSGTALGVLVIGSLAGVLPEAVMALVTGAVFRWSTGGAHLHKPYRCMIISISIPLIMAYISRISRGLWGLMGAKLMGAYMAGSSQGAMLLGLVIILFVLSFVIIRLYAPAETENKPISPGQRARIRTWAYLTLLAWAAIMVIMSFFYTGGGMTLVIASCLGLTWQMLSVTPVGYSILSRVDGVFDALEMSFGRRRNR
ncbi:MAG: accessory gene regulator B family protein [Firmicutes bacterium]|nr:accessory gene regulator B family protein [Bacillota bacterium]